VEAPATLVKKIVGQQADEAELQDVGWQPF
jgi:hypothetical protein